MDASRLTVPTPDGPFTIVATTSAVLAAGWTNDADQLVALIDPKLRPGRLDHGASQVLDAARTAVAAYYDGDIGQPMTVPVLQQAGPFRLRAWEALRQIPAGEQWTYAQLAAAAGNPAAVRAAGSACASNAAALFVPCHRVVRSDGTTGGFRYGPALKRRLLDREQCQ